MIKALAGNLIWLIYFVSMILGFFVVLIWSIWVFQTTWITLTALGVYIVVTGLIHRWCFPKKRLGWIMDIFTASGS